MEKIEIKIILDRVRTRRKDLAYSYQDLADETGISKSTLQRYETGAIKNIPLDKLETLASALRTTPLYLIGLDDDPIDYENTGIKEILKKRLKMLCKCETYDLEATCSLNKEIRKTAKLIIEIQNSESYKDEIQTMFQN